MTNIAKEISSVLSVGHFFSKELYLTESEIIEGATQAGDMNPIHHNLNNQHSKEFGSIIASGSHVTGLFTAMIPTEFLSLIHI